MVKPSINHVSSESMEKPHVKSGREFQTEFEGNITIAHIRNELRNNRYSGDIFKALEYLLKALEYLLREYDDLQARYLASNHRRIREFGVTYEQKAK